MNAQDDFVPVLDENELPEGSMKVVSVEGLPILLVKMHDQIFAVSNRCPHMGCLLSGGTIKEYIITCPCHDWRFDLRTGEYEDVKEIKLTLYKWRIESGKVWIKIEEDME